MRVAILSAIHASGGEAAAPVRGLLAVAGRSIAALQLDLALRLGCERVVCFAEGLNEGVLPLLHRAEQGGASFHALSSARSLSGLVRAQDDLFLFAEGVVPDPLVVGELLGERSGIIALPAETGLDAGFERIDRDHAWAGVARLPGAAVERLAEMPFEIDAVPALLRIGLQTGTRLVPLPPSLLADRRWAFVRDEREARAFEAVWLSQRVAPSSFAAPGYALADRIAVAAGPGIFMQRGRAALPAVAGVLSLGGALAAAAWQLPVLAFAAAALAAFALRMSHTVGALSGDGRPKGSIARAVRVLPDLATDATLLAVVGALAPPDALVGWLFAGLVLLLALRAALHARAKAFSLAASDRVLLALLLALCAVVGKILPGIQVLAVAVLAGIYFAGLPRRLTHA